ncbi:MAG: NAD(P)/FAD-dependent oxidoreductase [Bacteroidetes bacterium]|nr:NAD(P)/FAD-dependent oxidoreductase [Bacteroidota bacterium]
MQQFDVIICGAGPAGSTCALGLFDAGLHVALLDKQSFPREKICGDAYGGYTYKILNTISPRFGARLLALNQGAMIKRAQFVSPKGHLVELRLKGSFTSLPRHVFDNFLLTMVKEETNTSVFENTTAQKISIEKDHILVTTHEGKELKAKMVIGCDGAHSIVQSALTNTRETLTETYPGIRAYYKNVKGLEPDCLEIHFLPNIPKGYFWIFPSTNGLSNVGIAANKKMLAKHNINMRKEFHYLMNESPQFKERFAEAELVGEEKGWSIPIGYFDSTLPISGNRVILCGDAAALVEPATGEGIGPAMSSGRYAAWQIKKCFAQNNFSADFMKGYDKAIRKKYVRNYFFKTSITNLYYRMPFLMDWVIGFFSVLHRLQGRR